MFNTLVIEKIVYYVRNPLIIKIFFYFNDYRSLINSSNSHFDYLYSLYGTKKWRHVRNLKCIQSMIRLKIPINQCSDLLDYAASKGQLDIVIWLYQNMEQIYNLSSHKKSEYLSLANICSKYAMNMAAQNGHLEVLKWLHDTYKKEYEFEIESEIKYLNNHNLRRSHSYYQIEECTKDAMDMAAINGHLEIVKWLHLNRREGCSNLAMDLSAAFGHLDVVKWLHENRKEGLMTSGGMCTKDAMNLAAAEGHLEMIKWLHENRTEGCSTLAMDYAARNGHFEIIKWLHKNRKEGCSYLGLNFAAEYGRFEILQWLYANTKQKCTQVGFELAAKNNHYEVIKWLLETHRNDASYFPNYHFTVVNCSPKMINLLNQYHVESISNYTNYTKSFKYKYY